jgi:hypothetical protein
MFNSVERGPNFGAQLVHNLVDKKLCGKLRGNAEVDSRVFTATSICCLLAMVTRKRAGSVPFALKSACPESWQIVGKWVFEQETGKQKK